MSILNLEFYFIPICTITLVLNFVAIYIFEVVLNLGVYTFILGELVFFGIQFLLQIIIIYIKCPEGVFQFPKFGDIFKDTYKVFNFCYKFGLDMYFDFLSLDVIPFFLLFSADPVTHILVWMVFFQIMQIIYYIGYSVGAYIRNVGTHYIGTYNSEMFKILIKRSILYFFIVFFIISTVCVFLRKEIMGLFVTEEIPLKMGIEIFLYFSIFCFTHASSNMLNSTLRLIGYITFPLVINFFKKSSLVIACFVGCVFYGYGALYCAVCLIVTNIIGFVFCSLRLAINFEEKVNELFSRNQAAIDVELKDG